MIQTVTTGHNNLLLNKYKHSKAILLAVQKAIGNRFLACIFILLYIILLLIF
jgi:hypothetical protein